MGSIPTPVIAVSDTLEDGYSGDVLTGVPVLLWVDQFVNQFESQKKKVSAYLTQPYFPAFHEHPFHRVHVGPLV